MKIIFGLGNPGNQYSLTRHNIGFMALDKLSARWGKEDLWKKERNCLITEFYRQEKIILAKPQTYMNLSGEAAAAMLNWYKISANDIIVIYDDTALAPGKLRLRLKGTSGGHRGIESLINCLDTEAFLRLKIGVGNPPAAWDLADYVLANIGREELILLNEALEKAAEALECVLECGAAGAMNKFN